MVKRQVRVKVKGKWHTVEVEDSHRQPFQVIVDGETLEVEVRPGPGTSASTVEQPATSAAVGPVGLSAITQGDRRIIRSPMPGRIVSVSVKVWDEVTPISELCVLETMKMEQSIRLSQQGIIRAVFIEPGQTVAAGEPLIQLG